MATRQRLRKTSCPTVATAIPRPRLFRRLNASRTPVTWICGPPGSGKTTLVAGYVAASKLRLLWYEVDAADADIATFFYYLGGAAPGGNRPLPLLTPEYRAGLAVFARRYFRLLFQRLRPPFAFVLDNYHDAPHSARLHEVVRQAAAELPGGGRIIVISRANPPPAFARMQLHGEIDLIGWPDLRLTPREAVQLAAKTRGRRGVSANEIRQLHTVADGWIAGLLLLIEQRSERRRVLRPVTHSQLLFDYFAGEIFDKTDPTSKNVLLATAHLPSFTAEMAEELTGERRAAGVLAALHQQNYFTNRSVGKNGAYRYHLLFREFLRTQASRTLPAKRIDAIRRKAARLLSCSGEVETAVELVREIPDWEALADLVVRHAPILLAQGRVETVDGWLADVPDGVFGRSPWMAYWRAISRLGRGHDDCHIDGERALAGFRRDGDANGMLLAWSLIVLNHVMIGWLPAVDEWIPRLDEILQQCGGPVSPDTQARVAATMLLAIGFRQPAHRDGPSWAARSRALTRDHPDLSLRALAATGWFFYHWVRGEPAKASIVADEMRAIAERDDIPSVVALHAAVPIVWDELLWALPSYRRTVVEMRERAEATGLRHVLQTVILLWGAFAALSHGDDDTADAWIADLGREVEKWGPTFLTAYHGLLILQALARGRTDRAIAFVHEIERLGYSLPNEEVLARVCAAYAFTEARSEEEARRQLARALDVAVTHASRYLEWTVRLADAHCSLAHGDVVRGREALAGAMTIGREGRYINSPVWVPSIMARLCARALDWDIEAQYVRDLVNRRRLVCDPPPVHVERWPWRIKILTLGQFAVLNDDRALRFTGKLQKKPLALLKAMIALGPIRVPEDRLIDALWPDADGDAARRSLTSAVFRLRRMLGNDEVVIRSGGAIGLDSAYCWVDLWAVSRLLDESESAMSADSGERRRLAADAVVRAAELYRGPLSITADDAPWLAGVSDELRRRLVRELLVVAQHSDRAGDLEAAADTLRLALRVDPCSEIAYRRLMVAFHRLGRPAEVKAAYDRCRDSLGRWLGVRPSASTEAVLRQVTSLTEASDR